MNTTDFELIPTNSLVSGSFDILKMDVVDDPFTNVLSVSAMNMEENYFASSINFLKSINESYIASKVKLYKAIAESTTDSVMLESFSDYYVQIDAIIQKFLKFIKYKIDNFLNTVFMYMDDNKIITEHRKALLEEIKNYTHDGYDGFNYTIKSDIPDLSVLDNFNGSLFDELYKPGINDLSVDSVKQTVTAMELETDVRVFRGKILGMSEPLSDSEFVRHVYLIFRDNVSEAIELNIDAKEIRDIAERWFSKYDIKHTLEQDYKNIEKVYESVLKKIEAISKNNNGMTVAAFTNLMPGDLNVEKIDGKDINNAGAMMSPEMMLQIDIYTKAKIDQLQKYTDITCMVLTAKMDAIKDMIRQDRAILLNAIEVLDHPEIYYDARSNKSTTSNEDHPVDEGAIRDFVGKIKKKIEAGKKKMAERKAEAERLKRENEYKKKLYDETININRDRVASIVQPLVSFLNGEIKNKYFDLKVCSNSEIAKNYGNSYYKNMLNTVCVVESDYPMEYWNAENDQKAWDEFCDWITDLVKRCNSNPNISKLGNVYDVLIDDTFYIFIDLKDEYIKKPEKEDSNND